MNQAKLGTLRKLVTDLPKVKAITFHGREQVKFDSVPEPQIEAPNDAIVKVQLAGICGSDLHVYHERETGLDLGTVMGHEFVGEIVAVGSNVQRLRVGELVLSPFTTSCGDCFFCQHELTARCLRGQLFGWVERGRGLEGAQAEFVRVPMAESTLIALPDGLHHEDGLLLGDIFATGFFCVDMAAISPAGVYVVIGCGPVGIMAVIAARELGAEKLYAVDSIAERLTLAESCGAQPLDFSREDIKTVVEDVTEGRGADAVLEVVGSSAAQRLAMELIRPGGTIATVGVHTVSDFAFSPVEAYDKNLTFKIGRCPARHYLNRLVPLILKQDLGIRRVISHRLPLREGPRGYEIFDKKLENCTKAILQMP